MTRKNVSAALGLLTALLLPAALAWPGGGGGSVPAPGDPLPGLAADQLAAFNDGRDEFTDADTFDKGLGPVFNGRSCGECHVVPAVGGSGADLVQARVTRFATITNGLFDPLTQFGGSLVQRRSIQEDFPDAPMPGEVVPPEATIVSHRITTPLFGDGLIAAIPDQTILQRVNVPALIADGITGRPNRVLNPETGMTEIGRFGWKAQVSTLHVFSGDAYLNELGITSPTFPNENLPQGQPIPVEWQSPFDQAGQLEDDGEDVDKFTNFMTLLAPLARRRGSLIASQGERLFTQVGCANCHTPSMTTGGNAVAALSHRRVDLFSDLLLHDMGPGLAEGIVMGSARGSEFRTAPLWGVSRRPFLLHDGRATTPMAAVLAHGGEALRTRNRFIAMRGQDRLAILAFLNTL